MMKTLLVVRGAEEEKLVRALVEAGAVEVSCAHDGQTAREALSSGQYALAFLADGSAELAKELAACSRAGVLLPLAPERMDEAEELTRAGVFVLARPLTRAALSTAMRCAAALYYRLNGAAAENERLRGKLNETRMVSRAKLALIRYLNMSEPQAHRYIEKQAMDRRVSRLEVAMSILANYDT